MSEQVRDAGADGRALRVEHIAHTLSTVAVDVSVLVRDAYAQGYADGLARARAESSARADVEVDVDDVAQRRPTRV